MRNSNVKIFTAFTYLLLLVLILGSVAFLIVQRIQLSKQADTYAQQIVERINKSYLESGSFTTTNFNNSVTQLMGNFRELVKVVTIVNDQDLMQNRFRLDSIDPNRDANPNWQNQRDYDYNPLLYETKSYDLQLPGQPMASVEILFQRLPIQLIKDVLQLDTIVILALLILSFLAFLIIPKRDPTETAWALRSVAEEDDMYQAPTATEELPTSGSSWASQDLSESSWEEQEGMSPIQTQIADEDDEFDDINNTAHIPFGNSHDPWGVNGEIDGGTNSDIDDVDADDDIDTNMAVEKSENGAEQDFSDLNLFANLEADEDEVVDLSFNDSIAAEADEDENHADNSLADDNLDLSEEDMYLSESFDAITTRAPETGEASDDEVQTNSADVDEIDSMLPNAIEDLDEPENSDNTGETQSADDDDFAASLNAEFSTGASEKQGPSEEQNNLETEFGEELVDDLDESLGDDELEPIDDVFNTEFFSQLATSQANAEDDLEDETKEQESFESEIDGGTDDKAEDGSEDDEQLTEQETIEQQEELSSPEESNGEPGSLDPEYTENLLGWLTDFLEDQKDANEDNDTPDLSVALIDAPAEDIAMIQASLEQDLALKASFLPHDHGLALVVPSANIQEGIEQLQSAASRLPNPYLENLRMGITGVSASRSELGSQTVLKEMQYALANCDQENNISIFDANDQVFNQQRGAI